MTQITEFAIFLLLTYLFYSTLTFIQARLRSHRTFASQSIPGPDPSFFTGNFPSYLLSPPQTLTRWVRKFGPIFGYYAGGRPILVLSNLEDIQSVLITNSTEFPNRQRSIIKVEPFESSLILERDDRWKRSRRILSPAFTAHKMTLKTTKLVINESIRRMMDSIVPKNGSKEGHNEGAMNLNLTFYMKCLSLDIITRLAFNMMPGDIYSPECELRQLTFDFLDQPSNGPVALTLYLPFFEKIFFLLLNLFGSGKLVHLIENHLKRSIEEYSQNSRSIKETKVNLLDFMLEQKSLGNLCDLEVRGNSLLVLLAGYETSAVSQMFTLYNLAKYPTVQDRLRKELRKLQEENPNSEDIPCYFDTHRCDLLDRVWYESLRLYPPVPNFVSRQLAANSKEFILPKSRVAITPEISVQIPVLSLHHNPEYWPHPYDFNPDRKNLPENLHSPNLSTSAPFLPFGAGPRNCVGRFLALSEARAAISALILKYQLELTCSESSDSIDQETGLLRTHCPGEVMHPANEITLRLIQL